MFKQYFTNDPPRSLFRRAFYRFWQTFWQLLLTIFCLVRVHHQNRIPKSGPMMICANHQSNMDPIVVGCITPRRINFLAKKTLFKFPLGPIISMLDSIPIERDGIGIGGIKETLKRLKRKESVLIFPEGQRSWDGELLPLMGGFTALVKRVPVTVVPMGIEGAHDVWPRGVAIPKPGNIQVVVGHPIPYEQLKALSDDELRDLVGSRIRECFCEARSHYRRVNADSHRE